MFFEISVPVSSGRGARSPRRRAADTYGPVGRVCAALALLAFASGAANADVVGRLRFTVKNAADEKVVSGATITLKDTAGVRGDVVLKTDALGVAVSVPLENRVWRVTTTGETFQTDARDVTVAADVTTDVEILLEPATEKVIRVTGARNLIRTGETASATRRTQAFLNRFPATAGNRQSLSKALRTNPGFVEDSVNQAHPRGEHSQTSVYINGFLLPGALQGRAGQFLAPETIETLNVLTGGYAPEYGGELAAVLNLTLRAGAIEPFQDVSLGGGSFGTFDGSLTFGGQGGVPYGAPDDQGRQARKFGYLVNLTQRNTNNALEPPQPNNQSAHNNQTSTTGFGNFDFRVGNRDALTFTINTTPARTEIANRTGLPDRFKPFGQGYGYAGALSAEDAAAAGIASQEEAGQDIYQKDNNTFAALQYRKQFSDSVTGLFSIGYSKSKLDILNNNPNNNDTVDPVTLPDNSSIEFSPTIKRSYDQAQFQGNVTVARGPHTIKFGGLYSDQSGDESYKLVPGSKAALTALYATDPRLAPGGGVATLGENGELASYDLSGPSQTPTLSVTRSGYYAAGYAQDTWRASRIFTLNYGLRLDAYKQKENLSQDDVNKTLLSPRINAAVTVLPLTVFRASYNKLFSQPPLAQGAILGNAIKPQITDMYEGSLERQIGRSQTVKAAYYKKEFRDQIDTGLLIEGTQIGVYTSVNLGHATVKGFEFSYELSPNDGVGSGAYLTYANATAKPRGLNNLGEVIDDAYNDHDQLNTITGGYNYTLPSGAFAGLNVYYGSGLASSVLEENGKRQQRTEVNLSVNSGPRLLKSGVGLNLAVENLFDSRKVINFGSAFSGTRFQQGRRVLLSLSGRF